MEISPLNRPVQAADVPLEKLAANSHISKQEKVAEASRQFEAVLLRQILSNAQKPHFPSKFSNNSMASGIYRDLVTNQLADGISRSGVLGLATLFAKQLGTAAAEANADETPSSDAGGICAHGASDGSSSARAQKHWRHAIPSKGAQHPATGPHFDP